MNFSVIFEESQKMEIFNADFEDEEQKNKHWISK